MSNFKSWKKFPGRCRLLLERYYEDAEQNNLEVTLLLTVASASICIRRDHLCDGENLNHDAQLKVPFNQFCSNKVTKELCHSSYAEYHTADIIRRLPDEWPGFNSIGQLASTTTNGRVLGVLRNALSHGNLFLDGDKRIDRIVFLSETSKGSDHYRCLVLTPHQLFVFVNSWIDWCRVHESSVDAVAELLEKCDPNPIAA
jgi:hypothetical protein